ncbi:hypothetical protein AAG906_007566 [Vitis piasezkii]
MRLKALTSLSKLSAPSHPLQASDVYAEIINVAHKSNIRRHGRSYAVSVPSYVLKDQKSRKRVPKDERKVMVESFINKYRGMNAGKFPTVSEAQKHVGGSYYIVRELVQELEHKAKTSPLSRRNENLMENEPAKERKSLAEAEKVSTSRRTVDAVIEDYRQTVPISPLEVSDASSKNLEAKGGKWVEKILSEEVTTSSGVVKGKTKDISHAHLEKLENGKIQEAQKDHSGFVETPSVTLKGETEGSSQPCLETIVDGKKEEVASESLLNFDGTKHESEQNQGSPELDDFSRDISRKQNEEELPKGSTVWANLKSFAGGIINMWRKL